MTHPVQTVFRRVFESGDYDFEAHTAGEPSLQNRIHLFDEGSGSGTGKSHSIQMKVRLDPSADWSNLGSAITIEPLIVALDRHVYYRASVTLAQGTGQVAATGQWVVADVPEIGSRLILEDGLQPACYVTFDPAGVTRAGDGQHYFCAVGADATATRDNLLTVLGQMNTDGIWRSTVATNGTNRVDVTAEFGGTHGNLSFSGQGTNNVNMGDMTGGTGTITQLTMMMQTG